MLQKGNEFCISKSQEHVFNFTKLDKSNEDYIVYHSDKQYRLQLCRELVAPCKGKKGYNICMKVNNTEIGFGEFIKSKIPNFKHFQNN